MSLLNIESSTIPEEVLMEILLKVPYAELLTICTNNPLFYSICTNEYYWEKRTILEFGNIKNDHMPWHQFYRLNKEQELIDAFNTLMANPNRFNTYSKVYDLTNFDLISLSGIRLISRPIYRGEILKNPSKQKFIIPEVLMGNKYIKMPIGAERRGKSNFENYVRVIVGKSNYSELVDRIINDFNFM